jgi:hypothetical protein
MLLVNSDIYSIISGHRNYFMDLKNNYSQEIKRYVDLYEDVDAKNIELEKKLKNMKIEYQIEKDRLENELYYLKEKVLYFIVIKNIFSY